MFEIFKTIFIAIIAIIALLFGIEKDAMYLTIAVLSSFILLLFAWNSLGKSLTVSEEQSALFIKSKIFFAGFLAGYLFPLVVVLLFEQLVKLGYVGLATWPADMIFGYILIFSVLLLGIITVLIILAARGYKKYFNGYVISFIVWLTGISILFFILLYNSLLFRVNIIL